MPVQKIVPKKQGVSAWYCELDRCHSWLSFFPMSGSKGQ
jgi:hypothetical protein